MQGRINKNAVLRRSQGGDDVDKPGGEREGVREGEVVGDGERGRRWEGGKDDGNVR